MKSKAASLDVLCKTVLNESDGAVLAELSFALVLLLPIFVAVVKISVALNTAMDLIQASRILTRNSFYAAAGATDGVTLCTALQGAATSSLSAVGLNPQNFSVSVTHVANGGASSSPATQVLMVAVSSPGLVFHGNRLQLNPFPAFVFVNSSMAEELGVCELEIVPEEQGGESVLS